MKNLGAMLKEAQKMQSKMQEMQQRLADASHEGAAAAGLVKVTLDGKGEMKGVSIDKSVLDPDDVEMLEDLILAAHNDAKAKIEEANQKEMADMTQGLPLPPGFKLPF